MLAKQCHTNKTKLSRTVLMLSNPGNPKLMQKTKLMQKPKLMQKNQN